jgi:hypothetical protein
MTIVEHLQSSESELVPCGDRWLVWGRQNVWKVYEQKPFYRLPLIILETDDEQKAVKALQGEP